MLIWEGIVTRKDVETYKDKGGKDQQAIRFSIENCSLVPEKGLTIDDLPDVGTPVRAMVNRFYLTEKKRDMWVFLGLVQNTASVPAPAVQQYHANGQATPAPLAV